MNLPMTARPRGLAASRVDMNIDLQQGHSLRRWWSPPIHALRGHRAWNLPVQLTHGARSRGRYPAMGLAARQCNPTIGQEVTVPDAAHSMNRENPSAFNQAVLKFFSGRCGGNICMAQTLTSSHWLAVSQYVASHSIAGLEASHGKH